ncbi:MAG: hypothetical protein U1A27_00285 [Phycisphaerae bacterium]
MPRMASQSDATPPLPGMRTATRRTARSHWPAAWTPDEIAAAEWLIARWNEHAPPLPRCYGDVRRNRFTAIQLYRRNQARGEDRIPAERIARAIRLYAASEWRQRNGAWRSFRDWMANAEEMIEQIEAGAPLPERMKQQSAERRATEQERRERARASADAERLLMLDGIVEAHVGAARDAVDVCAFLHRPVQPPNGVRGAISASYIRGVAARRARAAEWIRRFGLLPAGLQQSMVDSALRVFRTAFKRDADTADQPTVRGLAVAILADQAEQRA